MILLEGEYPVKADTRTPSISVAYITIFYAYQNVFLWIHDQIKKIEMKKEDSQKSPSSRLVGPSELSEICRLRKNRYDPELTLR